MTLSTKDKQISFLNKVKDRLPKSQSIVTLMQETLKISMDAAYRRLRGQSTLTFEEANQLAIQFGVSMDSRDVADERRVDFDAGKAIKTLADYKAYNKRIIERMVSFSQSDLEAHMTYVCNDAPIFYAFKYQNLGRMKAFYWAKAILNLEAFKDLDYIDYRIDPDKEAMNRQVWNAYASIPSVEIWSPTCYLGTLKQIYHMWESKLLKNLDDVEAILTDLDDLIDCVVQQATTGRKTLAKGIDLAARFNLHIVDIAVGNNVVLVEQSNSTACFLSFNTFNFMETSSSSFYGQSAQWAESLKHIAVHANEGNSDKVDAYQRLLHKQVESTRQAIFRGQELIF